MFAFALWDGRRKRLLLARDRSGKKRMFYNLGEDRLTFASEIKAILTCPWVSCEVATERLAEFLTAGYVRAPWTLYRGIEQLPPAAVLTVERSRVEGPRPYWALKFA